MIKLSFQLSKNSSGLALSFYDPDDSHLHYLGHVDADGYAVGRFWLSMGYDDRSSFFNGFLFGEIDPRGAVSGDDAVFVYPDMKTVLVGKYADNEMMGARESRIVAERCNGGMKEIRVARPKKDAPIYRYFRPTEIR